MFLVLNCLEKGCKKGGINAKVNQVLKFETGNH